MIRIMTEKRFQKEIELAAMRIINRRQLAASLEKRYKVIPISGAFCVKNNYRVNDDYIKTRILEGISHEIRPYLKVEQTGYDFESVTYSGTINILAE